MLPAASACVTTAKGRELSRDILALQAQFDELRSEKEKLKSTLARASKEIGQLEETNREATEVLRRNSADFGAQMDSLRTEVQRLRGANEEALHEIAALKAAVASLQAAGSRQAGPAPLPEDKDALYGYGYKAMNAGDLEEGRRAFQTYADRHPGDKRADNAVFFAGEILYQQGKYVDAVVALQEILKTYPEGDKVDDAIFGIGQSFQAMGSCKDSLVFFQDLTKKHPDSPHVGSAKELLDKGCP